MALCTPSTAFSEGGAGIDFGYYESMHATISQAVASNCGNNEVLGDARAAMAAETVKMALQATSRFQADVARNFQLIKDPKTEALARFNQMAQSSRASTRAALISLQSSYDYEISRRTPASSTLATHYQVRLAKLRQNLAAARNNWEAAQALKTPPQSLLDQVAQESAQARQNVPRLAQIGKALDTDMTRADGCLAVATGRAKMIMPFTGSATQDFANAAKFQEKLDGATAPSTSTPGTSTKSSGSQTGGASGS